MYLSFLCFCWLFIFYVNQNPHVGVLSGDEMAMHHLDMVYEGSYEVPDGLKVAENPTYPIGSQALSRADHMDGMMDGVEVTIVGTYETIAYATTYTSTNTGMRVEEHKWVVHEELVDVSAGALKDGAEVFNSCAAYERDERCGTYNRLFHADDGLHGRF
ncbi:YdhK family protein [Piscibacillus salipiscarius]|uniref:YdhK family protein n=1 Tax=Piscibacillus salipiscarius TaxID=299480 RepID=UPI0006CF9B40|nr:YdhK family protein [Piscibacillus salipiscarius]